MPAHTIETAKRKIARLQCQVAYWKRRALEPHHDAFRKKLWRAMNPDKATAARRRQVQSGYFKAYYVRKVRSGPTVNVPALVKGVKQ